MSKKQIISIVVIVLIIFSPAKSLTVNAETLNDIINNNINTELDQNIITSLQNAGLKDITVESIKDLNYENIFKIIFNSILDTIKNPLIVLPILITCSIYLNLYEITCFEYIKSGGFISNLFKTSLFGAVCIGVTIKAIYKGITALKLCNTFSVSLIPIYISIIVLFSKPTQSAAFNTTMLTYCNSFSSLITYVIIPAVSMCCTISFAIGLTNSSLLLKLNNAINLIIKYGITAFMAVFSTVLTLKCNISGSVDTITGRLTKGAISSFVPIIGKYVSESLTAIKGSASIIKSGIGIYAVVAIILIILPSMIELILLSTTYKIADTISNVQNGTQFTFLNTLSKNISMIVICQLASILMFTYSFLIVLSKT